MVRWRGRLRHLLHYITFNTITMIPIAKNILGESLPVLQADTVNSFLVDGSIAHAGSAKKKAGIYRLTVMSSTDDAGVMIQITQAGTSATVVSGMFLSQGGVEYVALADNDIIDVISGIVNVTPFL